MKSRWKPGAIYYMLTVGVVWGIAVIAASWVWVLIAVVTTAYLLPHPVKGKVKPPHPGAEKE